MSALFAIAVVGLFSRGELDGGVAQPRVDQSAHNMFGRGQRSPSREVDLCQICHVPNHLRSARVKPALWAPKASTRATALDVNADPAGPPLALRWTGSTLACMRCHDGTISSINIAYRPTSGSLRDDGTAADPARASGKHGPSVWPGAELAAVMGNHPVSVPYPLEGKPGEFRAFTARATPLDPRQWQPDPRTRGLRLLPDTTGFDVLAGTAGVECVSCHDPHGTANTYFLRLPREHSELCLGCHRK